MFSFYQKRVSYSAVTCRDKAFFNHSLETYSDSLAYVIPILAKPNAVLVVTHDGMPHVAVEVAEEHMWLKPMLKGKIERERTETLLYFSDIPAEHRYMLSDAVLQTFFKGFRADCSTYSIKEVAQRHYSWVDLMGWHNKTVLENLALVASEVGEAVNECRGAVPTDKFGEELADIVLRVMDLSVSQGIDLQDEIAKKW